MPKQTFTIRALPPSINHYKMVSATTRKQFPAPKVRSFMEEVACRAKEQGLRPYHGLVSVIVRYYFKDKRKRDVDNFHKALIDGLKGIAFEDDSQIVLLCLEKFIDRKRPRTEVIIEEV